MGHPQVATDQAVASLIGAVLAGVLLAVAGVAAWRGSRMAAGLALALVALMAVSSATELPDPYHVGRLLVATVLALLLVRGRVASRPAAVGPP